MTDKVRKLLKCIQECYYSPAFESKSLQTIIFVPKISSELYVVAPHVISSLLEGLMISYQKSYSSFAALQV